jgi:hypothetical protein
MRNFGRGNRLRVCRFPPKVLADAEETLKPGQKLHRILELTLPDRKDPPS